MAKTYPALAIANWFIERNPGAFTQMHLQKLIYFAHGWCLAIHGRPLIKEKVQAWSFGPVIRDLYDDFKEHGSDVVAGLARRISFVNWRAVPDTPTVDEDDEIQPLLVKVLDVYGERDPFELSAMTHRDGTPWHDVWYEGGGHRTRETVIPNDTIKKHFVDLGRKP